MTCADITRIIDGEEENTCPGAKSGGIMDRMETARRRLAEGGFVVVSNVPSGVQLGVDCKTYEVGPKFRGLKMIPPGIHLLHHYRLGGAQEIQGLWFESHPGSVLALEWDASEEDIGPAKLTPESYADLCAALARMELDPFLAPYPEEQYSIWTHLTSLISKEILNECGMPLETKILPGDEVDRRGMVEQGDEVKDSHNNNPTSSSPSPGNIVSSTPGLAQVPRFILLGNTFGSAEEVKELTPEELTRKCMDRSHQLQSIIVERFFGDWKRLLGEIQAAFIAFLILSSPMGLRHWQHMTVLLCSCDSATRESPEVFVAYLKVLHSQLKQIPADFFISDLTSNNFLHGPLGALFETLLGNSDTSPELSSTARKLLRFVQKKFFILERTGPRARLQGSREVLAVEDWSLVVGTDEDGPTVVPYEEVAHVMGSDSEKSSHTPSDVVHSDQRESEDHKSSIPPSDSFRVDAAWAKVDASLGIQAPSHIGQPLNNCNNGSSLFSITYPNLFAAMEKGEDILMTAARLIDGDQVAGSIAQQEAKMFIEREAGDLSGPLWGELSLRGTH